MSVKIEILDYKYGVIQGAQIVPNNSFTSSSDWDTGIGWTISGGSATHSGGNGYLKNTNVTFIEGKKYRIKYKISGRNNGKLILANHLAGNQNGFIQYGNGTFTYDWIQGSSNNDKLSLAGWSGFDGYLHFAKVYPLSDVDWEKSVIGELDVTSHSDFPLAMTFQISDIKDLTSTSGDYSKTFKIPATKNNNKLLKHSYIANIDTDVNLTENKKCRILINNLYSLKGLIKITGVGGYGETPSYYNCVFFGNNISWADDVSNKYMDVIDWGVNSKNLAYNKTNIMATWQHEDCDAAAAASDPPIVYPIVSYGNYNPDGEPRTIQLLDTAYDSTGGSTAKTGYHGYFNAGDSYGTPLPSPDWRPAIFIKDTLERIFAKAGDGYKINSTFMETDMFKKLVWLLPNFKYNNLDDRYSQYAAEATFDTSVALTEFELEKPFTNSNANTGQYDGSHVDFGTINTNFTLSNDTAGTDITYVGGDEGFQIAEYGYYNLKASGLSVKLSNLLQDGAIPQSASSFGVRQTEFFIDRINFKLELKTVGQNSWNSIDIIQDTSPKSFTGSPNTNGIIGGGNLIDANNSIDWYLSGEINLQNYWLNKGDRVRISFNAKFHPHPTYDSSFDNAGDWSFDVIPTISEFNIEFDPKRVEYGQTYDLEDVINTDYKQIDFIKGVAHAFNLQITTDEGARVVNIEPFDTFYKDYAQAIDWTYKLDRSKQIEDKWVKSDLKRDVVFKYKSDGKDKKVEYRGEVYFDGIKDEYPYQETLPKTFEKGESKYENPFFAGTYNAKDKNTLGDYTFLDTAFSACLWEENVSASQFERPDKGFEFLPRLLYWNKYSPAGAYIGTHKRAIAQTWSSVIIEIAAEPVYASFNIYPQATSINRDSISSPILSYGNVTIKDYNDATAQYASSVIGKGLFETYYKNMFEMLKSKPRLRTVYIDLKVKDVVNLDFTKLINIDGVYWRINKVVDYQPNKNQSTKVELIEWLQLGAFAATAPSFDGSTDPWGSWNPQDGSLDDNQDIGL